jgi:hypothetical protein
MTITEAIEATITAGPRLRAAILAQTGEDPVTEPAFAWSDGELPCDGCGHHDPTALVSFDGDTEQRVCADCWDAA